MVRKSSQIQTFSNKHKDTFSVTFESDDNWFADVRTLHSIESDLSHYQWIIGNGKIYEWMQIILHSFMRVDQLRLLNKFTFCGTLVSLHLVVCIQSVMNYLQQSNLIGWHNNTKTTWNEYIVDFFDIIQQKENYLMSFWQ